MVNDDDLKNLLLLILRKGWRRSRLGASPTPFGTHLYVTDLEFQWSIGLDQRKIWNARWAKQQWKKRHK